MSKQANVTVYLIILWIFLGMLVSFIMLKYPNYNVFPWHTYPTVFIQYCSAIGIILLVPIDLTITIIGRQYPDYYYSNIHTIIDMYLSLYWPTLILSNIVLVLQEQYNMDGFFTIKSKIKNILIQLSYQIIIGLVLGSIFFGILVGKHIIGANMDAVLLTYVLITNTIGLGILIVLLGYGLVVYPQTMWYYGDYQYRLQQVQHKAVEEYEKMTIVHFEISMCVKH